MSNPNDNLPSAADNMGDQTKSPREHLEDGVETVETFASDVGERTGKAYTKGNAAVAKRLDPLPGLLLAATAGFIAGCIWTSGHQR